MSHLQLQAGLHLKLSSAFAATSLVDASLVLALSSLAVISCILMVMFTAVRPTAVVQKPIFSAVHHAPRKTRQHAISSFLQFAGTLVVPLFCIDRCKLSKCRAVI